MTSIGGACGANTVDELKPPETFASLGSKVCRLSAAAGIVRKRSVTGNTVQFSSPQQ